MKEVAIFELYMENERNTGALPKFLLTWMPWEKLVTFSF